MYTFDSTARVSYKDTDRMGYSYYGNYPTYYEIGRTELFRSLGMPYKFFEDNGIMMPVLSMNVKYIKPAYYDDVLTIKTFLKELPSARIKFDYEIYNADGQLINIGDTVLVFVDGTTKKPMRAPEILIKEIEKYFI